MRAIVTGAAGFIGSTLVDTLVRAGHDVVGLDAFTDYYDVGIKRRVAEELAHPRFQLREVDLASHSLDEHLAGADVVFHLAGQPGVRASWGESFDAYVHHNILATQRVLEAAQRTAVGRVVYASSSSVYGDRVPFPAVEESSLRPFSPYGVTKLAAEHLCSAYADNFGLHTVSLRLFTVFGPRQRPDMAFTRFIRAALNGDPIVVNGAGSQVRDFTFVDDVVDAFMRAAFESVAPGTVVNISGGNSASVLAVVDELRDILGTVDVTFGSTVPGDVARTGGAADRAHSLLGWEPRVSLSEGLRRQVAWIRDRSRT